MLQGEVRFSATRGLWLKKGLFDSSLWKVFGDPSVKLLAFGSLDPLSIYRFLWIPSFDALLKLDKVWGEERSGVSGRLWHRLRNFILSGWGSWHFFPNFPLKFSLPPFLPVLVLWLIRASVLPVSSLLSWLKPLSAFLTSCFTLPTLRLKLQYTAEQKLPIVA